MARQWGDPSSGWRNRDSDEASGGWIVPVDGGFGTLSGSYAGGFLQWMDDFGLLWSVWRGDSSSDWRDWALVRCSAGGFLRWLEESG